jgi:hypothetical protein
MAFRAERFSFDKFKAGGLHEKHLLENRAEHENVFRGDRSQNIPDANTDF